MIGLEYCAYDNNPYNDQGFNFISNNISIFNNEPNRKGIVTTIQNSNNTNSLYSTYGFSTNQNIALKFKGSFIPNVTGTWQFLLGNINTKLANDDISYLWVGNNALTPTASNYTGMCNYETPFASCYINVPLTAGVSYPILMYWGQGDGGFSISLGIVPPGGTLTYNGTPYFRITERTILQQIGLTNETDANYFQNVNTLYNTTNSSSTSEIIEAINENLAELTLVQNELNTDNNINQEILIKKQQLLKFKNDDLMKQLQELEIIESNIANKSKIIEQTNYNIEKGNSNINYLIISIILAIILCACVALYGYGKLDDKKFLTLVTIIALCYLCLFLYANNIFYLKDSMSYLFNARSIQSLENKLTTWQSRIETAAENNINEYKQTWIQNNCTCPIEEESISDDVYAIDPNSIVK